jgi:hypothetical protein
MPITDDEDVDLDTQERVILDNQDDELEDDNDDPDDQDDSQDDDQSDNQSDDDDQGDDADDDQDDEPAPPAKSASRGQQRQQVLANRAKAAEAEAAALKEELQLERQRLQLEKKAVEDAKEAERLAAMDPTERELHISRKENQSTKQALAFINFKIEDSSDKSHYSAKAIVNPLYAKYADRVEAKLAEMRKGGQNSTREVVLDFLIGRDARLKAEQGDPGAKRRKAASRVDAARSKPARARSDAGGYKPKGKSAEDRLDGVLI